MPPKKGGKKDIPADKPRKGKPEKEVSNKKREESDDEEQKDDNNIPVWLRNDAESKNLDVVVEPVNMNTPTGVPLLSNTQLKLVQGHRYGLIGRNGIGKTTLMRVIASKELKSFPKQIEVLHVEQEAPSSELGVLAYVMEQDICAKRLKDFEAKLEQDIDDGTEAANANELLQLVYEKMDELDVHNAEPRALQILTGLGFSAETQNTPVKELSGGWRMRVALATALFVSPDILLLDEPTNHLDFPAIIWLENYMKEYQKTCVIVSHDRNFLNTVCTDIIDFRDLKLAYYRGDYNGYLKTRGDNLREQGRRFEAVQRQIAHLKGMIERFKTSQNDSQQVSTKIKELKRLEAEDVKPVVEEKKWGFKFPEPEKLKAEQALLRVLDVSFGYPGKALLLRKVNLHADLTSRIGVMGLNGVGKSTLIKLIKNEIVPTDGKMSLNDYARWASFDQHHAEKLDLELSPFEYMQKLFPSMKDQEVRNHLGSLGLSGNLALQKIGGLSGGQKSRLAFSIVVYRQPHLLVMDEPTNHLDLETVEALIEAVGQFKGGVLVVSHDVYFLNSVVNEYWAMDGSGKVSDLFDFDEAKEFAYKLKPPKQKDVKKPKPKREERARDPEPLPVVPAVADDDDEPVYTSWERKKAPKPKEIKKPDRSLASGFSLLSFQDEDDGPEPEEPVSPEPEPEEPEPAAEPEPVKKKKGKKTEAVAADGEDAVVEKKKKKKEKAADAEADPSEVAEKPKKKKKDKEAEDGDAAVDKEEKKKKKKKDVEPGTEAADGESTPADGEKKEKKKKKKDAASEEAADAEAESTPVEKKKKKKDKSVEAEEGQEVQADGEKKKKKKDKDSEATAEADGAAEEGEQAAGKKKKKKDKTADTGTEAGETDAAADDGAKKKKKKDKVEASEEDPAPEATEKKKKKKKDKDGEEAGAEAEPEVDKEEKKKKKKKDKDADASAEADGESTPNEAKKEKKKKKKDVEADAATDPGTEAEESSATDKKKKKKDKSAEPSDESEAGEKKKKKKKDKSEEEPADSLS